MEFLEGPIPRKYLGGQLAYFALWLGVTIIGACLHASPDGHGTHQELGLPPCPSVLFFDRPCPGCGLTTSWTALIHGDIPAAFHAHLLGPPLYLLFTVTALACGYGWLKGARLLTEKKWFNRSLTVFTIVFMAYGIGRMALTTHFANRTERMYSELIRATR